MADVEIHPTAKGTRSSRERSDEEQRKDALIYAGNAVKAALDALAIFEAIEKAGYIHFAVKGERAAVETLHRLLSTARRGLRQTAGDFEHPGYEPFHELLIDEVDIHLHD